MKDLDNSKYPQRKPWINPGAPSPSRKKIAENLTRKRRIRNLALASLVTVFQELAEDKVRL